MKYYLGSRTTVRTVTQKTYGMVVRSMAESKKKNRTLFDENLAADTIILKYGIQKESENQHGQSLWPDMRLYIVQKIRYDKIIKRFRPISKNPIRMSNGFITLNYAQDMCDKIHVYGMPEASHCDNVVNNKTTDVMYHYYEKQMGTECELYEKKLKAKHYGHHFLEEKKMYREWMENSNTLFFHAPEWL